MPNFMENDKFNRLNRCLIVIITKKIMGDASRENRNSIGKPGKMG